MASLDRTLRRGLENTVKQARRVAEAGARKALESLAVHHHEPHSSMSAEQRALRNRLRAHGRQLGDRRDERRGTQSIARLVSECAYEHWHRMLFARFLAENDLLIEPDSGVAVTLPECQELAREQGLDWLELASSYAVRMLPEIFRADDPVLEVTLPLETRSELEDLLKTLTEDMFLADDSLGWVYQFWQGERKDAVNASGNKIGADELPAVTQLFTEDYMVEFLLHNTLGAWWAGKVLEEAPGLAKNAKDEDELRAACVLGDVKWKYLRFLREDGGMWRPAAGTFEQWPKAAKEITVLDPCMGSGHFLVFALPLLVALRIQQEQLSMESAIKSVLRDNLYGLEIDQRCTQIAAFNLALAAWRLGRYQPLPTLNLACSGLAIGVSKTEWRKLAEEASAVSAAPPDSDLFGTDHNLFSERIVKGLESLHALFTQAPWLGSLIDPHHVGGDLLEAGFDELRPLLYSLLKTKADYDVTEMAVVAQGMSKAAEVLSKSFTLIVTNVPYLGMNRQDRTLFSFCREKYPAAKADIATVFIQRCLQFCSTHGTIAVVAPQIWLFLGSYRKFRETLLAQHRWRVVSRLGPGAFEAISGEIVNVGLFVVDSAKPDDDSLIVGIEPPERLSACEKAEALTSVAPAIVNQGGQRKNPDCRVTLEVSSDLPLLSNYADSYWGIGSGDIPRFARCFWELDPSTPGWKLLQVTSPETAAYVGRQGLIDWRLSSLTDCRTDADRNLWAANRWTRGSEAWGKRGIAISQMGGLAAALYTGEIYQNGVAAIVPKNEEDLPAIWCFCSSPSFAKEVRKIDKKLSVTNLTLIKVPFDIKHWRDVAFQQYPDGLPGPYSEDLTQWVFHGHPAYSEEPMQAAVCLLIGYSWPSRTDSRMALSSRARDIATSCDSLTKRADRDGIVCLSPIRAEAPAAQRAIDLLACSYGNRWSAAKLNELLAASECAGETLDAWLRDQFFEQHSALFLNRPCVWHIWDGLRDGFNALVNYHKLAAPSGEGRRTLEKLIYTYLGDWIAQQRRDQQAQVEGADARLAAALHLQSELKKILEGEPPYDIFVRWKPLHEQPVGWDPDINDGVRLNIRPFMTARPLNARAKNACILRTTPKNIKWAKDRGKEPERPKEDYPWFWGWDEKTQDFAGGTEFDGNRWNDLHYTNAYKQAARDRKRRG